MPKNLFQFVMPISSGRQWKGQLTISGESGEVSSIMFEDENGQIADVTELLNAMSGDAIHAIEKAKDNHLESLAETEALTEYINHD